MSSSATLGVRGAIAVDCGMHTNLLDICTTGDCVHTHRGLLGQHV